MEILQGQTTEFEATDSSPFYRGFRDDGWIRRFIFSASYLHFPYEAIIF